MSIDAPADCGVIRRIGRSGNGAAGAQAAAQAANTTKTRTRVMIWFEFARTERRTEW
jgi:hypothetical protein